MEPVPAEVTSTERDGVHVIKPVGEFDIAVLAPLRDAVLAAVEAGCAVVLEMSETTFIDSTILGVIVEGRLACTRRGRWLRIVAPRPNIRRILQMMALDTLIGIYPSVEAALAEADERSG